MDPYSSGENSPSRVFGGGFESNRAPLFNRRIHNETDNTIESLTPSIREEVQFTNYASCILTAEATAQDTLKAYLSSNVVVSTSSSFAQRHQSAQLNSSAQLYNEIGRGTFGIIFERPGTLEVVKRSINQSTSQTSTFNLWNDFTMHRLIQEVFEQVRYPRVHIPKALQYVMATSNEWWNTFGTKFDGELQKPANLLFAERILPIPQPVREALVDCFCPEQFRVAAKESNKNKTCLIHPLLGRRKGNPTIQAMPNLRNYELCVDQMEQLGLNVSEIIDSMAESLAILHWKAHVDAADIEFVFGTAPTAMHNTIPSSAELLQSGEREILPPGKGLNFQGRVVHLWMLDFNRVSRILTRDKFLEMALKGFVDQSKAYYPRPRLSDDGNANDKNNWMRFGQAYLKATAAVSGEANQDLAKQFLRAVENHYKQEVLRRKGGGSH